MRAWMGAVALIGCAEEPPEIWIDRSPIELGVVRTGETRDFSLQLANQGGGVLEIEPFGLRGDDDCAFELAGPDETSLSGALQGFITGTFAPARDGVHQVALYLSSNAETYPQLIVPICAVVGDEATEAELEACEEPPAEAENCVVE